MSSSEVNTLKIKNQLLQEALEDLLRGITTAQAAGKLEGVGSINRELAAAKKVVYSNR